MIFKAAIAALAASAALAIPITAVPAIIADSSVSTTIPISSASEASISIPVSVSEPVETTIPATITSASEASISIPVSVSESATSTTTKTFLYISVLPLARRATAAEAETTTPISNPSLTIPVGASEPAGTTVPATITGASSESSISMPVIQPAKLQLAARATAMRGPFIVEKATATPEPKAKRGPRPEPAPGILKEPLEELPRPTGPGGNGEEPKPGNGEEPKLGNGEVVERHCYDNGRTALKSELTNAVNEFCVGHADGGVAQDRTVEQEIRYRHWGHNIFYIVSVKNVLLTGHGHGKRYELDVDTCKWALYDIINNCTSSEDRGRGGILTTNNTVHRLEWRVDPNEWPQR